MERKHPLLQWICSGSYRMILLHAYVLILVLPLTQTGLVQGCWIPLWVTDQDNGHPAFREQRALPSLFCLKAAVIVSWTRHLRTAARRLPAKGILDRSVPAVRTSLLIMPFCCLSSSSFPFFLQCHLFVLCLLHRAPSASMLTSVIYPPKQPPNQSVYVGVLVKPSRNGVVVRKTNLYRLYPLGIVK